MKKLIMAVAIVCAAVGAQAAALNWQSCSDVQTPEGTSADDGAVTMYVYGINATQYATYLALGADEMGSAVYKDFGTSGSLSGVTDWGMIDVRDSRTFSKGETAYAAVVLTYTDGDGKEWYKGNIASYTFDADASMSVAEMDTFVGGDQAGMTTAVSWQAAPEPTSGLLLLIGMAGLALKRKRA